jgi:hypothetical protein
MTLAEKSDAKITKPKGRHGGPRPNSGGRRPGSGRKKGVPNVITRDIKEALLTALEANGGSAYFAKLAKTHPQVFCGLLAKVLPVQIQQTPPIPQKIEFCWHEDQVTDPLYRDDDAP